MNSLLACRLALIGFFLIIFSAKLWLLSAAGTDLPQGDQWDAEAVTLRAWREGTLDVASLLAPHNEHRLVTTRLFVLGLFLLNGQWSNLAEAVAAACVHALCAVALLRLARGWVGGGWLAAFGGVLLALFALPCAGENTLAGFQVQFYFLVLFSLGHLALTLASDRFSWRWAGGQLCGALAVVSLASGFLSSLAVLAVLGWHGIRRRWTTAQAAAAALASAFAAVGWLLKHEVAGHAGLQASGAAEFANGLLRILTWPSQDWFPWSLVLLAPAALFAWRWLGTAEGRGPNAVLAGVLGWVWLQCAATAWARGAPSALFSPRYFDLFALHAALGFICLARELPVRFRGAAAIVAVTAMGLGLAGQATFAWQNLASRNERKEARTRAFVATGDPTFLRGAPPAEIPYPEPETVLQRLGIPVLREILPPSVRLPVPVESARREVPPALRDPSRPVAWSAWPPEAGRAPQVWRSETQSSTAAPVLRFHVAGDLGARGKALRLAVRSVAGEAVVIPPVAPGERWKSLNVFRPAGEWWIEASADEPAAWFAFTAPIEVKLGTWVAERLIHDRALVAGLGACLLVAAGGLAGRTKAARAKRPASPVPSASAPSTLPPG